MIASRPATTTAPQILVPLWAIALALIAIATALFMFVYKYEKQPPRQRPQTFAERQSGLSRKPLSQTVTEQPQRIPPRMITTKTTASATPAASSSQLPVAAPIETENMSDNSKPVTLASISAPLVSGSIGVQTAELSGRVILRGTPPREIPIQFDSMCGRLNTNLVTTRHYVVAADGGLANVFVYLSEGVKGTYAPTSEVPVIDQVNCMFEQYITGVMVGQKFQVRNSDSTMHNVHLTPKVSGNKELSVSQVIKGSVNDFSFSKPEVLVRIMCNVHPWMFTYVGVVDHPFFAITDADGHFSISGVPPGTYKVEAYHLKTHRNNHGVTQRVTVHGGDRKSLDVTISLP